MSQLMDLINDIEKEFNVNEWTINGIHVWPIIRVTFAMKHYYRSEENLRKVQKETGITGSWDGFTKFMQHQKKYVNIINEKIKFYTKKINYLWHSFLIEHQNNRPIQQQADVIFLTYTTDRNYINGSWYDIFCDPLIEEVEMLKMRSLVIELAPNAEYRLPRNYDSVFIQFPSYFISVKAKLLSLLSIFKPFSHEETELRNKLEELKCFVEAINVDYVQLLPSWKELKYSSDELLMMKSFFQSTLKKVNPRLVFVVCYYSIQGMALNLACREVGIPSVDIQHGLQGDEHVAYGRWTKFPKNGYKLLPSLFWCWSNCDSNAIKKWNREISDYHQPVVGGHIWVSKWLESHSDLVAVYGKKALSIKSVEPDSLHILLTLQSFNSFRSSCITKAIMDSPSSWVWWVRLHPTMMAEREKIRQLLQQLERTSIELDLPTDLPLPALLIHADVHVTINSSVIIEAELFGIHSVATGSRVIDLFPAQIDSGFVVCADSSSDLINSVVLQASRKKDYTEHKKSHPSIKTVVSNLLYQVPKV